MCCAVSWKGRERSVPERRCVRWSPRRSATGAGSALATAISGLVLGVSAGTAQASTCSRAYLPLPDADMADHEEDHLVPLELGGSPRDPGNPWPGPCSGASTAHTEDGTGARHFDMMKSRAKPEADVQ